MPEMGALPSLVGPTKDDRFPPTADLAWYVAPERKQRFPNIPPRALNSRVWSSTMPLPARLIRYKLYTGSISSRQA